jgi:hypothetical protein
MADSLYQVPSPPKSHKEQKSRHHRLHLILSPLLIFIVASLQFNNANISKDKAPSIVCVELKNGNTGTPCTPPMICEDKRVSNNVSDAAASTRTYNTTSNNTAHNHAHNATSTNATYLIIHVGPVKTGSSSIQCSLQAIPF